MAAGRRRGPFEDADAAGGAPGHGAEVGAGPIVRRYGPDEVRAILRRATEEEVRPSLPGREGGLSLEEVEAAAVEAGIDAAAVRQAALSTLPPPPTSLGARLIGGPARRRHRVFLPGRLPPGRRRELGGALQTLFGRELDMEEGDGRVTWEEDHRQGRTRVAVRDVEGGVELEMEADRRGWVTLAGIGSVVLVGAAGATLAGVFAGQLAAAPLVFAVLAVAAVVGGMRLLWAPAARALHGTLERAVVVVMHHLEETSPPGKGALPRPGGSAASP